MLTKIQKRVYTEPTEHVWAERHKRLWALNTPSHATVAPAVRTLTPPAHGTATAKAPPQCARALACRRSRFGPSFATKTKCPARSESVCEHGDSGTGGARVRSTFFLRGRGQQAKRAGGRQAAEAAQHRAQRGRIDGSAPPHLARGHARPGLAVADAEQHAHLESTAITNMKTEATLTVSEVSAGLPMSMDAQGCARHEESVELAAAPLWRSPDRSGPGS